MIVKEMIAEKVFAEGVAKDIRNFLPAKYENAEFLLSSCLSLILQPASCISFLFVYRILLICNKHINTTPIMPPTNTPQINFNIITFSFSIFRGSQEYLKKMNKKKGEQKK